MSYIIAHIKINADKTYSVDIVDNQPITKIGLEKTIGSGETDFYIKIKVDQCTNMLNDCFGLSNGKSYRLDFDSTDFDKNVSIDDFLSGSNTNLGTGSDTNNLGTGSDTNNLGTGSDTNNENELTKVSQVQSSLSNFKNLIVEKLNEVGQLDNFKKLIVQLLETVAKPEVSPEAKPEVSPEAKPEVSPEAKPEVSPDAKPEVSPDANQVISVV